MRLTINKCPHVLVVFFASLYVLTLSKSAFPQERPLPEFFIQIDHSGSLAAKLKEAHELNDRKNRSFWVGYRFRYRPDVQFNNMYVSDEGTVWISQGDYDSSTEESDLESSVWRALDQLGDEEARGRVREQRRQFVRYAIDNWGLFYLLDARTEEILKVKLYHFRERRIFDDRPVFWFGDVDNEESFNFLEDIIDNDRYDADVVKPAIFVLSVHDHAKVIPFLKKVASGGDVFEVRKTAAFWLGQIPDERSFDALSELFDRESDGQMKEKLVFSMSQHESERVMSRLAQIAKQDENREVQHKAIFWLGQIDREGSLDVLVELLDRERSSEVKEKIIFSISQHQSRRAADKLIEVAETDPSLQVREKAVFWLGQMAGRKTLQALGEIVDRGPETELKKKAVFAISQHQDKELAVDMLIDIAQNHPHPEIRKKAMFWLGQTGDERAVDFFKTVLTR